MNKKTMTLAIAILMTTATSAMAASVVEKTSNNSDKTASSLQEKVMKISQGVMGDIRLSRFEIFNLHPDKAQNLVVKADGMLNKADQEWISVVRKDKGLPADDNYILLDSTVIQKDAFTVTPEKQKALNKANRQLKSGDKKGAFETLKLAGYEFETSHAFMPLHHTREDLNRAISLLKSGKYYEANAALKNAEDGIIVQTDSVDDTIQ
ncbi:YfdX family protein [Pantoea rodasii]|nr:YfdX family protein [Pantoea rodasii]